MSDDMAKGATIIDITNRLPVDGAKVTVRAEPSPFDGIDGKPSPCRHRQYVLDRKQRTVKCGACGEWLDPVWVVGELYDFYDKRVDTRLALLKDLEAQDAARQKREQQRRENRPTRAKRKETRDEHLARAAWQEYQAKLATIRAGKARAYAAKIDTELGEDAETA